MADDMIKINTAGAMASAVTDATTGGADPFAETKNELASRFELLPEDIKAAIMDTGYQEKLFNLAKAQKLTYEELGVLETETTLVLLGMTKPADYRDELQQELKKNDPEIDAIVKAVNEQVFAPIRASLERVYSAQKDPADYVPESIVTGQEEKPAAPVFPPASAPVSTPAASPAPAMPAPVAATTPTPAPAMASSIARPAVANPVPFPSRLNTMEKSVLEKSGVVIAAPTAPAPQVPASEIPDRANLLASIENPSAIKPNIVAEKLKTTGPVISATKTTDYSMPAKPIAPEVPAAPAKPYVDPYREPI